MTISRTLCWRALHCRRRHATRCSTAAWDATGLLLERYDEVRAVADRLPYIRGWP